MAVRLLRRWLAALCLLAAGLAGAAAEEFQDAVDHGRPRRMAGGCSISSAPRSAPAGDRFPIYVRRPAARAGMGSARDARAGATERHQRKPVRRDRTQPGAGAVAVRYRGLPRRPGRRHAAAAVALPGRFPSRRPVSRRPGRLRRGVFAAIQAQGRLPRTFAKPVEVQITGSILIYDLADPLGGKGEPVKALAAQFPDMRRFIREGYVRYAFTRFGVPYVVSIQCLEFGAAGAAAGLPRGLSHRRALSESLAHRRRTTGAAAPRHFVRDRRTADGGFARLHLLPGRRHHRPQQRAPARRTRRLRRLFANPFSAGESPGRHPLAILRQEKFRSGPRRLSVAGQFLRSPQLPGRAMRRRLRASGPGHPPRALPAEQQQRKQLAIRGSRPSSPSATAS